MRRIFSIVLSVFVVDVGLTQQDSSISKQEAISSTERPLRDSKKKLNSSFSIPVKLEDQIAAIDTIKQFIAEKKYNDAFLYAKKLENSSHRQIKARAIYLKGEVFFQQKEYDLAMQLLEEVVGGHAFSSVVLTALKRLIVCTEKLQLEKKKRKYYSILHDFFEAI